MIAFIEERRGAFGVEPICKLLPIAPSTYYENIAKRKDADRLSARVRRDIALKIEIRRVFEENFRGWIHNSSATPISFANASRGVL